MKNNYPLSCVDCGTFSCHTGEKFPKFCVSKNLQQEVLDQAVECYNDEENHKTMLAAAKVEFEHYCKYTRVEEIVSFAKEMGFHKIGIATCGGLLKEAGTFAKILRLHGFDVYGVCCKAGMVKKEDLGIDPACNAVGENACNPIFQAKQLNHVGTELNVLVGLCVGHDSLFYKYSDALVTTLITKDRVLGHNPAAALYTAGGYYKNKLDSIE
ncbi:MAG: DUF1847 domain-containing protein [Oscillospiraceae bacterium]|nr:DUF1847 domain-containing protein [Oscillospiraceae bacterium]